MSNLDDDDLFGELDDLMNSSSNKNAVTQQPFIGVNNSLQNLATEHNVGGFNGMDNTEIETFKNSRDYKNYSAQISNNITEANRNGKTIQEIFGLTALNERVHQSFNAFEHYDVDLEYYQDILDTSPIMQNTVNEGNAVYPAFGYMHEDIFLSLYKYKPVLLPESEIHSSTKLNRKFAELYLNTPEYIKLRQTCRMDQFNAAIGTEIIGKKLLEIIIQVMTQKQEEMEKLDELIEKEKQIDELLEENAEIDELLQEMIQNGQGGSSDAQSLRDMQSENKSKMQQFKQLANKIAEEMDELLENDDLAGDIQRKAGKSFDDASEQVSEVSDVIDAWGLGEGEKCRVAYNSKKEAIEKIRRSPKLKKMTDLIGRFKESAITEQKKKTKNGATEIHSVTTGNDVQSLLPSELALLGHEKTKSEFYSKFSEKRTLQYSKQSNKSKNKGPIIVCVDTSGSMNGDSEMWSKAMTMGVLEIAQMQKRDFGCILYDSNADDPIVIEKGEVSPEKVITICEKFNGGGRRKVCAP